MLHGSFSHLLHSSVFFSNLFLPTLLKLLYSLFVFQIVKLKSFCFFHPAEDKRNKCLLLTPLPEMCLCYWDNLSLSSISYKRHHTTYAMHFFCHSSRLTFSPFPPWLAVSRLWLYQLACVFICRRHILTASIISHCKGIWVLITSGLIHQIVTCILHMQMQASMYHPPYMSTL